jgi:hypothetical protein
MSDREMNLKEEFPLGGCAKCRMGLITVNGVKSCPNCSTTSEPSGLVNTATDPGHEAIIKLTASQQEAIAELKDVVNPFVKMDAKAFVQKTVTAANRTKEQIITDILNLLATIPLPKDIKEFKKISKVKTILQSMIQEVQ